MYDLNATFGNLSSMNNSSSTVILPPSDSAILLTWIYCVFMGISILLNAPMFLTIICTELRKRIEMACLALISGWEILYGFFYFTLGVKTIALASLGPLETGWTPSECLAQFYNLPLGFSTGALYSSFTFLAVDRFMVVLFFKFYRKLGTGYRILLLVVPVVFGAADASIYIVGTSKRAQVPSIHPSACTLALCAPPEYLTYKEYYVLYPANFSCILIYVTAMLCLVFRKKSRFASLEESQRKKQRSVNKFFAIIAVITFATMIVPRVLTVVMNLVAYSFWSSVGIFYTNVLTVSHSLLYGLVFWTRRSDIRTKLLQNTVGKLLARRAVKNKPPPLFKRMLHVAPPSHTSAAK